MELQGINGSGACDSLEEPQYTAKTPATSRRQGGFNFDWEQGLYPLAWDNMANFQAWRQEEELAYTIESFLPPGIMAGQHHYGQCTMCLCAGMNIPGESQDM